MITKESVEKLEIDFIDKFGLIDTIEMLADICIEKSAHLSENWQDRQGAKVWENAWGKIDKLHSYLKLNYDI